VTTGGNRHVFHIAERAAYVAALENGAYEADSLASEGFIHCSTRAQVLRTAARFFRGRKNLALLCIDSAALGATLRFETADGELFPHCYGPIPLHAIVAALDFPSQRDGSFELPDELSVIDD
jgi:uncharacterized protein (DUF952 family)